jgi:hypothetical protein
MEVVKAEDDIREEAVGEIILVEAVDTLVVAAVIPGAVSAFPEWESGGSALAGWVGEAAGEIILVEAVEAAAGAPARAELGRWA